MSKFYQRMADTTLRLITEYGAQFDCSKAASVERINGLEVTTPGKAYVLRAVRQQWTFQEKASSLIESSDAKLAAAVGDTDPAIGDIVVLDHKQYRMLDVQPVSPAGVVLAWRIQARQL